MSRLLLAAPLLLAAGCATSPTVVTMNIRDPFYSALGNNPVWVVMIGDDRIAMRTTTPGPAGQLPSYRDYNFPRTLPRTVGDVKSWQSSAADQTILVEARRQPCRRGMRATFEDTVRVTLNGQAYEGCGGRPVRDGRRG